MVLRATKLQEHFLPVGVDDQRIEIRICVRGSIIDFYRLAQSLVVLFGLSVAQVALSLVEQRPGNVVPMDRIASLAPQAIQHGTGESVEQTSDAGYGSRRVLPDTMQPVQFQARARRKEVDLNGIGRLAQNEFANVFEVEQVFLEMLDSGLGNNEVRSFRDVIQNLGAVQLLKPESLIPLCQGAPALVPGSVYSEVAGDIPFGEGLKPDPVVAGATARIQHLDMAQFRQDVLPGKLCPEQVPQFSGRTAFETGPMPILVGGIGDEIFDHQSRIGGVRAEIVVQPVQ